MDEADMELTNYEITAHGEAWRKHCKSSGSLKMSRGKVYFLLLGQCTQVLVDNMKQDIDWVAIDTSYDPNLLSKLIENFALNQSDNQRKMTHYDQSTTRVEVARQAGVCYHSPDLLHDKTTQPKMGNPNSPSSANKKSVVDVFEQECLAQ
jgi:hypothetical protein